MIYIGSSAVVEEEVVLHELRDAVHYIFFYLISIISFNLIINAKKSFICGLSDNFFSKLILEFMHVIKSDLRVWIGKNITS